MIGSGRSIGDHVTRDVTDTCCHRQEIPAFLPSCWYHRSSSSSSWCSWKVRRVSCSLILKMKLVPQSLLRSPMFLRPFDLYCSACFGSLCPSSIHVVATFSGTVLFLLLCSVLPFFCLIHWFFSLSKFGYSKCLKNFICAASKRCSSLFFSTQASLPNFNAALALQKSMQVQRHQGGRPITTLTLRRVGNLSRGHHDTRQVHKRKKRYHRSMICAIDHKQ